MSKAIVISNPQDRVKDCYAPAPKIDLTLRTNGEERVQVITSIGTIANAGFDAPTVQVQINVSATASSPAWTANMYWNYAYVFVAKDAYPFVENAVTGGGSLAPRSNQSPSFGLDQTNSVSFSTTLGRDITVGTSQRSDISHIWIYRTELFGTSAEATNAIQAGNAFWVGEIVNDPNLSFVFFTDTNVTEQEQIETDNFIAPEARYCVFDGQYFWMIGNDDLSFEVSLTASGTVVITDPTNTWFDGRNGQIAIFDGITSGGFDGFGSYYIKIFSTTTAHLYYDIALTNSVTAISPYGTTIITIRGIATVLFRSKVRNPFSWGFTDLVNDIQVPTPYNFALGGGRATSLAVLPNLNLLKIDTEAPNKCFTLSLKNAGTPNFEPSLRSISDSYCSSIQFAQFSATNSRGLTQTWALDTKSFAIIECDGSTQNPISDTVWQTLRNLSLNSADRIFFHGQFCPRLELNCMFVRSEGSDDQINLCIYYHWPTDQWGTLDVFDILCSTQILDPFTNELKLIVGTSKGMIGEFGAENQYWNWTEAPISGKMLSSNAISYPPPYYTFSISTSFTVQLEGSGVLFNWMLIYDLPLNQTGPIQHIRYGRIASFTVVNAFVIQINCDQVLDENFMLITGSAGILYPNSLFDTYFKIGVIEMKIGRFFNAGLPFEQKKLENILTSWSFPTAPDSIEAPNILYGRNYRWETTGEIPLQLQNYNLPKLSNPDHSSSQGYSIVPVQFAMIANIVIDQTAIFGIMITDRNYLPSQLMNYEMRVSTDAQTDGRSNSQPR